MVTLLAEVTRGNQVESIHTGSIAVTDREGTIVAQAGNPDHFAYFRSSAKPFQAISLIESGAADAFGFTPAELALCCASHQAERHHQDQVAAMLAKLGLSPEVLQCGCPLPSDDAQAGSVLSGHVLPSPLHCDCSGKHTGMIATCLHLGYPLDDYRSLEHPLQQTIRRNVSDVCMVDEDDLAIATDGCSVPTFGAPLRSFATAYAKLASALPTGTGEASHDAALARLAEAMIAHPENVAGDGNLVTELMRVGNGRIVAKSGAEGLICIGLRDQGLGIAIRIADGTFRAHPVVVSETLESLSAIDSESKDELLRRCPPDVHNHNGWLVGTIRPAFTVEQASA
jgi:L-asparaginase II